VTWPGCDLIQEIHNSPLQECWRKGVTNIDEYAEGYDWRDWKYFVFRKELVFDPYIDFSVLLDDKAISPPRDKFDSVYNIEMLRYRPPIRLKPEESRRVLLNILGRTVSHRRNPPSTSERCSS
jgi:hypothetical protein